MAKRAKRQNVTIEDCERRMEAVGNRIEKVGDRFNTALFGSNGRGGVVKDVSDIKSDVRLLNEKISNLPKIMKEELKGRLSGKDKAAILIAVITAITSIILTLLKK